MRSALCSCHLQRPSLLPNEGEIYFLKEGSSTNLPIKVNLGPTLRESSCSSTSKYFTYIFPKVEFKDEGSYQCVYQPKGISEPILSKKLFLKVKGNFFNLE